MNCLVTSSPSAEDLFGASCFALVLFSDLELKAALIIVSFLFYFLIHVPRTY